MSNPVQPEEVIMVIKSLPSGRAAGPSGLSYDHLKVAANFIPEIAADLALFYNDIILKRRKLPSALTASRLVALEKPGGGVRPIAVGESIMRILAIVCFRRVKQSSVDFFRPYQFAIGVPDGTTCAALSADLLFNQGNTNYLLNIDYKNAFNSIFRSSIYEQLEVDYLFW
ncbi:hypothetical protein GEMRC1_011916 [Eukaryota sp. GEM-RC1]